MADVEQRIINTQLSGKIEIVDAKFNQFMDEMRARDDKRSAEIAELRGTFQNIQNTLLEMQNSNRNQNVLVIIGVIAIAVAVFLK